MRAPILCLLIGCTPELTAPDAILDGIPAEATCDWELPENDWAAAEPPCLDAEGFGEGELVPDIRLLDQHGDEVSLWQFYGDLIFLDFSAEWCAPCAVLAEGVDELIEEVGSEGVSVVTVIYDGGGAPPPTQEDLQGWADKAGDVAPVLGDDGTWTDQVLSPTDGYPALLLIDRDMRVLVEDIQPPKDYAVLHAIESNL